MTEMEELIKGINKRNSFFKFCYYLGLIIMGIAALSFILLMFFW